MYKSRDNKLSGPDLVVSVNMNKSHSKISFLSIPKKSWLRVLYFTPIAIAAFVFILIISYSFVNPSLSTLMAGDLLSGRNIKHKWVPIRRISKNMPLAVILSEDNNFCKHYGVDWGAVGKVLRNDRTQRGASTLTMQLVKNLFLWPDRSYLRKILEVPIAYSVTAVWSKQRQMEIYLNVVEFGPGIYGVEAASRYFFKRRASQLSARQAALLTAVLPNPKGRNAGRPGPKTRLISNIIYKRMERHKHDISCISR